MIFFFFENHRKLSRPQRATIVYPRKSYHQSISPCGGLRNDNENKEIDPHNSHTSKLPTSPRTTEKLEKKMVCWSMSYISDWLNFIQSTLFWWPLRDVAYSYAQRSRKMVVKKVWGLFLVFIALWLFELLFGHTIWMSLYIWRIGIRVQSGEHKSK